MGQRGLLPLVLLVSVESYGFVSLKACSSYYDQVHVTHATRIEGFEAPMTVSFNRTSRGADEVLPMYLLALIPEIIAPKLQQGALPVINDKIFSDWMDSAKRSLKGKRVLDMATGGGDTVENLREIGVIAEGVDVHLTQDQKSKPYFRERDMLNSGYPDNSFDIVMTHFGPISYAGFYNGPKAFESVPGNGIKEMCRITKPGGMVLLGAVGHKPEQKQLLMSYIQENLGDQVEMVILPGEWTRQSQTELTIAGKDKWNEKFVTIALRKKTNEPASGWNLLKETFKVP